MNNHCAYGFRQLSSVRRRIYTCIARRVRTLSVSLARTVTVPAIRFRLFADLYKLVSLLPLPYGHMLASINGLGPCEGSASVDSVQKHIHVRLIMERSGRSSNGLCFADTDGMAKEDGI